MPKIFPDARRFSDAFGPAAGVNAPKSGVTGAEAGENGPEARGNGTKAGVNAPGPGVNGAADTALAVLRAALHSFMLRRTKAALVTAGTLSLPPIAEVALFAPMLPVQKQVYLSVLKKELPRFGGDPQAGALQNIVVQLRKACSHPYLFGGVEPEPFEEGEHLIEVGPDHVEIRSFILRCLFEVWFWLPCGSCLRSSGLCSLHDPQLPT